MHLEMREGLSGFRKGGGNQSNSLYPPFLKPKDEEPKNQIKKTALDNKKFQKYKIRFGVRHASLPPRLTRICQHRGVGGGNYSSVFGWIGLQAALFAVCALAFYLLFNLFLVSFILMRSGCGMGSCIKLIIGWNNSGLATDSIRQQQKTAESHERDRFCKWERWWW